jgi:predicted transcriptional regulator
MLDKIAVLVAAYVRQNQIDSDQLPVLIAAVGKSMVGLGPAPAVPVSRNIAPEALTCMECGATVKLMKRHLQIGHSLTPDAYKTKWHLPSHYPMTAPNYSARRRELAMASGLADRSQRPRR